MDVELLNATYQLLGTNLAGNWAGRLWQWSLVL